MELKNKNVLPTKILVQKSKAKEQKLASGIIIPNSADEITSMATVLLTGDGTDAVPMPVKKGDNVMFPPRSATRVRLGDDDLWLLNIQDVLLYW